MDNLKYDMSASTDTVEGCLEIITALRHVVTDRDNEIIMQKRWKEEARREVMDLKSKVSELEGQL